MNITSKDYYFISEAITEAHKSRLNSRHGCIAVKNGKIIARGYNNPRSYSNDRLISNTCSCHAEVDVLRKIFYTKKFHSRYLRGKKRASDLLSFRDKDKRYRVLWENNIIYC
jgi:tRNA(Arg) A34 adenosine deaminase TadA